MAGVSQAGLVEGQPALANLLAPWLVCTHICRTLAPVPTHLPSTTDASARPHPPPPHPAPFFPAATQVGRFERKLALLASGRLTDAVALQMSRGAVVGAWKGGGRGVAHVCAGEGSVHKPSFTRIITRRPCPTSRTPGSPLQPKDIAAVVEEMGAASGGAAGGESGAGGRGSGPGRLTSHVLEAIQDTVADLFARVGGWVVLGGSMAGC